MSFRHYAWLFFLGYGGVACATSVQTDFEPEMVEIPTGTFQMGSNEVYDEKPIHTVSIQAFQMGKYEVTTAQYLACVAASACRQPVWLEKDSPFNIHTGQDGYYTNAEVSDQKGSYPIVGISWEDAIAYTKWLSKTTGKAYRLPTEAEWEYAAKSDLGNGFAGICSYANVVDETAKIAFQEWTVQNCADGYVFAAPVGKKKPNPFGLYDTLGNVWEWTCNEYKDYAAGVETQCVTHSEGKRALRGGSWYLKQDDARVANRNYDVPSYRDNNVGFRVALSH
jgi:formylglycine-generating enzyme required for sulfatase activity